jgi:2-haloacid dehalogenase
MVISFNNNEHKLQSMNYILNALKNKQYMTFDCYGTLIDWETGLIRSIEPILKKYEKRIKPLEILSLYSKFESEAENKKFVKYSEILIEVMEKILLSYNIDPAPGDERSLVNGIKQFKPFKDTIDALKIFRQKYKLGLVTNTDNDIFEITNKTLEVNFDYVLTSEDIRCYKPATRFFLKMIEDLKCRPQEIVHVAQSIYHDIQPVKKLGIMSVHINRSEYRQRFGATPEAAGKADMVVDDLKALSDIIQTF